MSHPVLHLQASRSTNRKGSKNVHFSKSPSKKVVCWYCKKEGHVQSNCFKRKREMSTLHGRSQKLNSIFTLEICKSDLKRINCSFLYCSMTAFVDTASVSVVSKSFVKRYEIQSSLRNCSHKASAFNGNLVEFSCFSRRPLEIENSCIEVSFFVSPDLPEDAILGKDVRSYLIFVPFS